MTDDVASMDSRASASATMNAESRYSFTAQFIAGSALLTKRAAEIEQVTSPSNYQKAEHMALVVGAITQAAASMESALAEVLQHGPGHQLGSAGSDPKVLSFLEPITSMIDRVPGPLERWDIVLHVLEKPRLARGEQIFGDAGLLVGLRNELVHYRSDWDGQMTKRKLLGGLRAKLFDPPPFMSPHSNEFPHLLLSAACAAWAYQTAANFLDDAYSKLGVPSALDGYRQPGGNLHEFLTLRS